jgi:signal transduction histidine kinase
MRPLLGVGRGNFVDVPTTARGPWAAVTGNPLRFLSSSWPWRSLAYLVSGSVMGFACLLLVAVLAIAGTVLALALVGVVLLVCLVLLGIPVSALERRRLRLLDTEPVNCGHRVPAPGLGAWLRTRLGERATWRELVYTLLLSVGLWPVNVLAVSGAVVVVGGLVVAGYCGLTEPDVRTTLVVVSVSGPWGAVACASAALAVAVVSAYLVTVLAGAQALIVRLLLASREEELDHRVTEVTGSRERLVGAFEAEQRRIERDLHDGVQQRLVSLTMKLGLARLEPGNAAYDRSALVVEAHEDAKRTLAELRALVRGIHSQLLVDRGLGPAVQDLADRCPLPVHVDISVPRLAPALENAAYFVVSEALANAVKHAEATQLSVRGRLVDEVLALEVEDDGVGGAKPADGGGLCGLADRVAVVRGTIAVTSPPGGPTLLRVAIPCRDRAGEGSGEAAVRFPDI